MVTITQSTVEHSLARLFLSVCAGPLHIIVYLIRDLVCFNSFILIDHLVYSGTHTPPISTEFPIWQ